MAPTPNDLLHASSVIDKQRMESFIEKFSREIRYIADVMKQLENSKLPEHTIILLIHDKTGIGKKDIKTILSTIRNLDEIYLKPYDDIPF
jgi:3-phenylpropionate/cinnamic acid dioxygenase small subunit